MPPKHYQLLHTINQTIQKLKDNGFWIVSTDGNAKLDYNQITYDLPKFIVNDEYLKCCLCCPI